jgi:hypothetical protein
VAQMSKREQALKDALDAALMRLASFDASIRDGGTATLAAPQATTAPTVDRASTVVSTQVSGQIEKIAAHNLGARLLGADRWYNVVKGGAPLFEKFDATDSVVLGLNEAGRVVVVAPLGAPTPTPTPPKTTSRSSTVRGAVGRRSARPMKPAVGGRRTRGAAQAAPTPTPVSQAPVMTITAQDAPVNARLSKAGEIVPNCPYCKGTAHNHYTRKQVAMECAGRQYLALTGKVLDETDLDSLGEYMDWLRKRSAPLVVFAFDKQGYMLMGGANVQSTEQQAAATAAAPAPNQARLDAALAKLRAATAPNTRTDEQIDADLEAATVKNGGRRKQGSVTVVPAALLKHQETEAGQAVRDAVLKRRERSTVAPGVYTGFVTGKSSKSPGLICLLAEGLEGGKSNGAWIETANPHGKFATEMAGFEIGDKVTVKIEGARHVLTDAVAPYVIGAKLVERATTASGVTPGVQTSGKQKPPAPRGKGVDKKVRAARRANAEAKRSGTAKSA